MGLRQILPWQTNKIFVIRIRSFPGAGPAAVLTGRLYHIPAGMGTVSFPGGGDLPFRLFFCITLWYNGEKSGTGDRDRLPREKQRNGPRRPGGAGAGEQL